MLMNTVDIYNIQQGIIVPIGAHASSSSLATALELTKPYGARSILVQALTQNVRYTLDGTAPTATVGFQLKAGDPPLLIPLHNSNIKFIEETATAVLQYQWSTV